MYATFYNCTVLESAPTIPSSVKEMRQTFYSCTSLTGDIEINTNLNFATYTNCFYNTVNPITITGSCNDTTKAYLAGTANNGNVTY